MRSFGYLLPGLLSVWPLYSQTEAGYLRDILKEEILPPSVANFELRKYILQRVGKLSAPSSSSAWTADATRLREQLLTDVVFRGWPKEWVDAAPKFEDLGVSDGNGYRYSWGQSDMGQGSKALSWLTGDVNNDGRTDIIQLWANGTKLGNNIVDNSLVSG